MTDPEGRSLGYGFVEFRTNAAADAAVWTLSNTLIAGRTLFLRHDCDALDEDGAEAAARRESHAKQRGLIGQLAAWLEVSVTEHTEHHK